MISRTIEAIILADMLDLPRLRFATDQSFDLAQRIGARAWEAFPLAGRGLLAFYEGDRRAAIDFAEQACTLSKENAPRFVSPWVHGVLMLVAEEPEQRRRAVREAEEILAGDCIGPNHLWFRRYAIEASLNVGDWPEAKRYADELEAFTRAEPLPWADFFIRWGRTIADCGLSQDAAVWEHELRALRQQADASMLRAALPLLDDWLGRIEPRKGAAQ